jgi:hypothetical protein
MIAMQFGTLEDTFRQDFEKEVADVRTSMIEEL